MAAAGLGAASPLLAQSALTFTGNLGQSDGPSASLGNDYAQGFTTGANSAGYSLRSVEVEFSDITNDLSSSDLTASIHSSSGGFPGGSLGTLANPSSFPVSNSDQVLTFTSTGIDLAATTSYFLVIDVGANRATAGIRATTSGGEDSGGLPGWSITDGTYFRTYSVTASTWNSNPSATLKFRAVGVSKAGTPVVGGTPGLVDCSGERALTFTGSRRDGVAYTVRYVGPAANHQQHAPYAGRNACVPMVTEGGEFTLTFTADGPQWTRLSLSGGVSLAGSGHQNARLYAQHWLLGAVRERRDGDNNVTQQATALTFSVGAPSAAGRVAMSDSGSTRGRLSVPVVVAPRVEVDDRPVVGVRLLAGNEQKTEGQSVIVHLQRPSGFTGPIRYQWSQSGDFIAASQVGVRRTFSSAGWAGVSIVDDDVWEPDGSVTLEVLPGDDYRVSQSAGSATVRVRDNDISRAIVVSESSATLFEGDAVSYTVRLSRDPGGPVSVYARVSLPPASANAQRALGVCLWRCRDQRRAPSGHNHQAAWTSFNSSDWNQPKTFEVYRYHDDGYPRFNAPGSWTVTHHLGSGHGDQGPSLQITMPAPPPEPDPEPTPAPTPWPERADPVTDYSRNQPTPQVCTARGNIAGTVKRYHDNNKNRPGYAGNWARVLVALGWTLPDAPWNTAEPFTVAEAQAQEALWSGWTPIRQELERLETCRSAACQNALARQFNRDQAVRTHCRDVFN